MLVLQGYPVTVPLPWWCLVIAALLILSSVIWIPLIAFVKHFNVVKWKPEVQAFFPEEELIEEKNIKPHITTKFEKVVFGFRK